MPNKVRKSFDLALRKWITAVNNTQLVDGNNNQVREPSQIRELIQLGSYLSVLSYKFTVDPKVVLRIP